MNFRIMVIVIGLVLGGLGTAHAGAQQSGQGAVFQQRENTAVEKHQRELKADNKKFRESLKDMSKADRVKAIEEHRLTRFRENDAFRQKLHEDEMAFLKERLSANTKLTDADKEDLLRVFDEQYKENVLILRQRNADMMVFFEKTANDPALTTAQKHEELKNYFQQQKADVLRQREQQQQQRQADLQKKYSEESSSDPITSKK
jgi:hypothetical protein